MGIRNAVPAHAERAVFHFDPDHWAIYFVSRAPAHARVGSNHEALACSLIVCRGKVNGARGSATLFFVEWPLDERRATCSKTKRRRASFEYAITPAPGDVSKREREITSRRGESSVLIRRERPALLAKHE